jgi:hypothetical protein
VFLTHNNTSLFSYIIFHNLYFIFFHIKSAERTEDASRALAEKRELKNRVAQIQKDFEEEQQQTFEMRQDMTRQYKGMQEELLTRVCLCLYFLL